MTKNSERVTHHAVATNHKRKDSTIMSKKPIHTTHHTKATTEEATMTENQKTKKPVHAPAPSAVSNATATEPDPTAGPSPVSVATPAGGPAWSGENCMASTIWPVR